MDVAAVREMAPVGDVMVKRRLWRLMWMPMCKRVEYGD